MEEIGVNIGRLLGEVAPALFASPQVVIDELMQNSQRAKAKNVKVTRLQLPYAANGIEVLEVEDDGCGAVDPGPLLELATTGWSDEGADPFGLGFWATATVCSRVEVASFGWKLTIDADKLRKENSVEGVLKLTPSSTCLQGFKVRLYSPLEMVDWCDTWKGAPAPTAGHARLVKAWDTMIGGLDSQLESRVAYMPFERVLLAEEYLDVRYAQSYEDVQARMDKLIANLENGEHWRKYAVVPTGRDVTWAPEGLRCRVVETKDVRGVLWPQAKHYSPEDGAPHSGLRLLYDRRPVTLLDGTVGGVLEVSRGTATPRAPDRTAFVRDHAWYELKKLIRVETMEMYRSQLLLNALDLTRFDGAVDAALDDDALLEALPVELLSEQNAERDEEQEPEGEGEIAPPELPGEMEGRKAIVEEQDEPKVVAGLMPIVAGAEIVPEEPKPKKVVRRVHELEGPVFWVRANEQIRHRVVIEALEEMDCQIVVVAGKAMERALNALKTKRDDESVKHVADVAGSVRREMEVGSSRMDAERKRVLEMALVKLARVLHVRRVQYGVLRMTSVIELGGRTARIPQPGTTLGACQGREVYVQSRYASGVVRKAMRLHPNDESKQVTSMVLMMLPLLAHEKAHAMSLSGGHGGGHGQCTHELIEAALGRLAGEL